MGRIILTGDTHGSLGIHRLGNRFSPPLAELGVGDVVIICGDFGLVWSDPLSKEDCYWLRWLSGKPFDVLFVDGNHENHRLLATLPTAELYGDDVGVVTDGVYHLRRGRVYEIGGYRFLTMGGAHSHDRQWRTPFESWWPEEVPNEDERVRAMGAAHGGDIDFVVTHEAPRSARIKMVPGLAGAAEDEYSSWLDELDAVLGSHGGYTTWFFGHHHRDSELGRYACLFEELYEIGAGWLELPPKRYLAPDAMPLPEDPLGYTALELAQCAGINEDEMDEAITWALMDSELVHRVGDEERLVHPGDVQRLDAWLRKNRHRRGR